VEEASARVPVEWNWELTTKRAITVDKILFSTYSCFNTLMKNVLSVRLSEKSNILFSDQAF